jgi:hypothetical protein
VVRGQGWNIEKDWGWSVRGNSGQLAKVSKFLSLILRHQPEVIGLRLDTGGWVAIAELVAKARAAGVPISEKLFVQSFRAVTNSALPSARTGNKFAPTKGILSLLILDSQRLNHPNFCIMGQQAVT